MLRVGRIVQGLEHLGIARRPAAVLGRTAPGAVQDPGHPQRPEVRFRFLHHLVDPDQVAPAVAEVVQIGQLSARLQAEPVQASVPGVTEVGRPVPAQGRRVALDILPDLELVQVAVLPTHGRLEDEVEPGQAEAPGHLQEAPDTGTDVLELDVEVVGGGGHERSLLPL